MLPNFFIVGAPKAGTTSLYYYLDQHPEVYLSPIKEPCYFASEIRQENMAAELHPGIERDREDLRQYLSGPMREKRPGAMQLSREDYLRLFENVKREKAIGEASVIYLWSPSAAANIAAQVPQARIIMMLRDPADRAYSQYLESVTTGAVRRSFRDQMERNLRDRGGTLSRDYPFLELGMYYEQVKRYLDLFSKEQVRIQFYEQYQWQPAQTIAGIFRFLQVDAEFVPDLSKKYHQPRIPRSVTAGYWIRKLGVARFLKKLVPRSIAYRPRKSLAMDPKDRAFLVSHYREDIQKLSGLLDRDLSGWLR